MLISLADIDWHCLAFHTKRQRLLGITRDPASGSEVIRGSQRHYSQNRPRDNREVHQPVNHLVQRTVSAGSNQQIHFACFRNKSSRISFFRSHSYFDAMPDFSLPNNCSLQRVIADRFPVENQLNFSTTRLSIHRTGNAVFDFCLVMCSWQTGHSCAN